MSRIGVGENARSGGASLCHGFVSSIGPKTREAAWPSHAASRVMRARVRAACYARSRTRRALSLHQLHTPVLLPPFGRVVLRRRFARAESGGRESIGSDAVLRDERGLHRRRALLRERLVRRSL